MMLYVTYIIGVARERALGAIAPKNPRLAEYQTLKAVRPYF